MSSKSSKKQSKRKVKDNTNYSLLKVVVGIIVIVAAAYIIYHLTKSEDGKELHSTDQLKELSSFKFEKHGELTFNGASGNYISTIDIEIADNDEKRTLGLMYRRELAENQGMLFIFPQERFQSFWMRNTFIPLDIIFINTIFFCRKSLAKIRSIRKTKIMEANKV